MTRQQARQAVDGVAVAVRREGGAVYRGDTFIAATLPRGRRVELSIDTPAKVRFRRLWQNREQIARRLATAPVERRPALEAALRGADLLVRHAILSVEHEETAGR